MSDHSSRMEVPRCAKNAPPTEKGGAPWLAVKGVDSCTAVRAYARKPHRQVKDRQSCEGGNTYLPIRFSVLRLSPSLGMQLDWLQPLRAINHVS
jgi:hypothetical protein